jgi:exodeoxyribonuclease-3
MGKVLLFFHRKKGYNGVAVWSKIKSDFVNVGIENKILNNEGRILHLDFKNFTLFNIYFPNVGTSQELLKFKMEFYDYLEYLKSADTKKPVLGSCHC